VAEKRRGPRAALQARPAWRAISVLTWRNPRTVVRPAVKIQWSLPRSVRRGRHMTPPRPVDFRPVIGWLPVAPLAPLSCHPVGKGPAEAGRTWGRQGPSGLVRIASVATQSSNDTNKAEQCLSHEGNRTEPRVRNASDTGVARWGSEAPIPCTYLSPDTENDSCPIVSEPVHVTFANDRLSSHVALRSGRSQPIVSQDTCAPDRSQPHKLSASVVA